MRRLWTEPVVDFKGKWVSFETMKMDPKPIQKPHVPIIVGGYAGPGLPARGEVRRRLVWLANLDPERTQEHAGPSSTPPSPRAGKNARARLSPSSSPHRCRWPPTPCRPMPSSACTELVGQSRRPEAPDQVDKRLPQIGGPPGEDGGVSSRGRSLASHVSFGSPLSPLRGSRN